MSGFEIAAIILAIGIAGWLCSRPWWSQPNKVEHHFHGD